MVKTKINGIPLDMPFSPYPAQIVSMSKLIASFLNKQSSLIESPTGTGKSFSILCSALGYLEFAKRNSTEFKPCKIFICSRTHKQLDQLIEQLRKTIYRPKIALLASKAQYCINPKIKDVSDKNTACSELIRAGSCVYFKGKDRLILKSANNIYDIEELRSDGKKCIGCPYYAARSMVEDADVIFAPYNYLIDPKIRESCDINLSDSIIIIDEAHNIEDVCRSAGSLELSSKLSDIITNELVGAIRKSVLLGEIKKDFLNLLEFFKKLKDNSQKEEFHFETKECNMRIKKGNEIVNELEKIGITKEYFLVYKDSLRAVNGSEEAKGFLSVNSSRVLDDIQRIIGAVIFAHSSQYAYCFKISNNDPTDYVFNFWLLDPAVMFSLMAQQARSISLLSGTLTPFSSFNFELKHNFTHKVTAPHIIKSEQVFVANIRRGHLNQELCGTYQTAGTSGYLEQISKIIIDISRKVQKDGGTLVFVPSYSFLNKLKSKMPEAIIEPKSGKMEDFEKILKKYRDKISKKEESVLICVYRGKAAEGIDFRDEYARAVISIGIPYPSIKDPQISLKKEYNDKYSEYNGRLWYEAQAYRALNQALGRVIRHSKDWGAVFLLDSRFGEKKYQNGLPSWAVENLRKYENYEISINEFNKFIESNYTNTNE